ncbi:MAG: type III pantothenate kinase [Victivallales bacterium]|nr:type III pantothenate kinase [Victivallales bacterium]
MSQRSINLVNIGNTHTSYAVAADGVIGPVAVCPTAEVRVELFAPELPLAGASVVPAAAAGLAVREPFWLTWRTCPFLRWDRVDPTTLGADRIANALYLSRHCRLPAVCLDCGTAITMEAVDGNGFFCGGAILPGRMLSRRALHDYTAQLPLPEMSLALPERGTDTLSAMRLGIDGGAIGAVTAILERIAGQWSDPVTLVAVGGDADFFVRHIPGLEYGGQDFTLRGILMAWEEHHAR